MAAKKGFRVPTLDEMDTADADDELVPGRSVFKRGVTKQTDDGPKTSALAQSPPKRMISQKALLSRQPLSMRSSGSVKKKAVPKTLKSTPEHAESTSKDTQSANPTSSRWAGQNLGSDNRNAGSCQLQADVTRLKATVQPSTSKDVSTSKSVTNSEENQPTSVDNAPAQDEQAVRADLLPTLAKLGKTSSLVVSSRQRGNPILKYVRNVPFEYGNIVPDYVMGQSNCALYLSLRYHQLNPEYIHERLRLLGHSFELRVLLVQVDIKDPHHLLKDLAKICILADCTLMLAFSAEEAGRYLETYKVYENKAAEAIMEQTEANFGVQLSDCLTRVKSVNKTDCSTLLGTFGSLQSIMKASSEDLSLCPGFGPQKAKRLHDVFREPFLVSKKKKVDKPK